MGLQVQSMDSSHVALVSLMLRESAFVDFKCDRPTSLGMNIESLGKIFKMCGPNDSLKLTQIESEHMEIPEQQYKVVVKMPSGEFQKICRDLKEFGETMTLTATKEGLKFSVAGDVGAGNVFIKPRDSDKPEERVNVTVHENVTSNFALRYLVNFSKAAPLCGTVELGLGADAPLLVKYHLEKTENGHMQFYLAPKIDE